MPDERVETGPEEGETAPEGAAQARVRLLQAETAGLLSLALTDRMRELAAAWIEGKPLILREEVGQGLELSVEVRREGLKKLAEVTLYRADDGGRIAAFQARATDAGFDVAHRLVDPAWRGGTGTLMLGKLEQLARACADRRGAPFVCEANVGQPDVLEFFARAGFSGRDPDTLDRVREDLRTGKIIIDDGYMFPAGTPPFSRTKKSLAAVRVTLAKTFHPAPKPRRRGLWA